uniref:Uncharacterized protein n=3 Tax=Pongo abelii TaxID=9601 RepID=H2P4Y0_PONAB
MPTGSVPDLEDSALDIVEDMLPERVSYTAQNSYPPVPDLEECALDILENKKLSHMVNYTAHNSYRPPENCLSLKFLPPSEEDDDDAQILPSPVQDSPEDNLSSVSLPRNEDYDGDDDDDDDDDDAQILPSPVQASVEDNLSLICLPPSEDDDWDDDHHDAQILPSPIQAWPEDRLFLRLPPRCKHEKDDDGDLDAHITAQKENDLTLESLSEEEIPPAWPEDRLFLRLPPRCKHEKDDDGDLDAHITAQKENDLTLESLSDEEIPPGIWQVHMGPHGTTLKDHLRDPRTCLPCHLPCHPAHHLEIPSILPYGWALHWARPSWGQGTRERRGLGRELDTDSDHLVKKTE